MSFVGYEPLFLKYRPQKLEDVLGQNSVKETLVNAINNSKIVHAYLLTGPRGSGKTSSARILAKSLNCSNALDGKSPSTQPCGVCESCVSIANSSSIDVVEIDAASHGGVDDARQIVEKVNLASVNGKFRVYIIDEVHMLSNAAFNALLKVIEEPPSNVVFILATTEVDKVPKTIASRCQQLRFRPITIKDCLERLEFVSKKENINISSSALELIAEHSDGAMRDALSLLDQIGVFSTEDQVITEEKIHEVLGGIPALELSELAREVLSRDASGSISSINTLILKGKDPVHIVTELADFILRVLEAQNGFDLKNKYVSETQSLCQTEGIENYELVQILDALTDLEYRLKQGAKNKNLLRASLLKICNRADIFVARDLMKRINSLEEALKNPRSSTPSQSSRPAMSVSAPKVISEPVSARPAGSSAKPYSGTIGFEPASENPGNLNDYVQLLQPNTKGFFGSVKTQILSIDNGVLHLALGVKQPAFAGWKARFEQKSKQILNEFSKVINQELHTLKIENNETLVGDSNPVSKPQAPASQSAPELDQTSTPCNTRADDKLSEVISAGVSIFGGKEID
jgi:DNA polymerase-3 subunit gamma/tau